MGIFHKASYSYMLINTGGVCWRCHFHFPRFEAQIIPTVSSTVFCGELYRNPRVCAIWCCNVLHVLNIWTWNSWVEFGMIKMTSGNHVILGYLTNLFAYMLFFPVSLSLSLSPICISLSLFLFKCTFKWDITVTLYKQYQTVTLYIEKIYWCAHTHIYTYTGRHCMPSGAPRVGASGFPWLARQPALQKLAPWPAALQGIRSGKTKQVGWCWKDFWKRMSPFFQRNFCVSGKMSCNEHDYLLQFRGDPTCCPLFPLYSEHVYPLIGHSQTFQTWSQISRVCGTNGDQQMDAKEELMFNNNGNLQEEMFEILATLWSLSASPIF